MRDLLVVLSPEGIIELANHNATAALGQGGGALLERVHPEDHLSLSTALERVRQLRHPSSGAAMTSAPFVEIRVGEPGAYRWVAWTVTEAGGTATADHDHVVMVGREVTDREALRAQLGLADRMLSVGTLAAGVAHEINNPLAAVLANLRYVQSELQRHQDPLKLRDLDEALDDAVTGAQRVARIVASLRTFAKGSSPTQPQSVIELVERAIDLTGHPVRHKAHLVRDLGPVPQVEADASKLTQVFLNLLMNAVQALPEARAGQEQVIVRTRTCGGDAVVEIEDTGPGVCEEDLPHIFEPFFTTWRDGAGLGLWVARSTITSLGGTITYRRDTDRTVFEVRLPPPGMVQVAPRRGSACLGGRVLVVDDEKIVADSIERMLSRHFDVEVTTDGLSALQRMALRPEPDVILCDLTMPGISGMELYDRSPPHLQPRFVFVSGGPCNASARSFLAAVHNHQLDKPFEPAALIDVISAVVASRST
ncbi:MAG TPA: response regulator, partial [Deltaproteobacteria bacterium]|nr:response regulator [Deltaproteobacteria bacterium]